MPRRASRSEQLSLSAMKVGDEDPEGFVPIEVETNRGAIEMRYYAAEQPSGAALFVGGTGGGWDTPVRGALYPTLCEQLPQDNISCLRVRYRDPGSLREATLDVLAGIAVLQQQDIHAVGLVGHSFGGAVVIQAAAHCPTVRTCLPLSTQGAGIEPAAALAPRCSLFLFHGTNDEILPPQCSQHVFDLAGMPKTLTLFPGARHGLDEAADVLPVMMRQWLVHELSPPAQVDP